MKIIIVGSGGIGNFLVKQLAGIGHEVFCVSRNLSRDMIFSGGVWYFGVDVTSMDSIKKSHENITNPKFANWKYADALIYAAGVQGQISSFQELDPGIMLETYNVNVVGLVRTLQVFGDLLTKTPQPRTKVITFGGGGADKARVNFADYAASKAASVRYVETLASELNFGSGFPCDVNIVAPGMILSGMTKKVIEAGPFTGKDEFGKAVALRENPETMAKLFNCINFLLSPQSDGISGKFIASLWDNYTDLESYLKKDAYQLRRIAPDATTKV